MSYHNNTSSNSGAYKPYQFQKHKEATKTVMVPNFSAISAQANSRAAMSSETNRHDRERSPPSNSSKRGDNGYDRGNRFPSSSSSSSSSRDRKQEYFSRQRERGPWNKQPKYYCEVCCINCMGQMSYEAHIAGQQHLKCVKNAALAQQKDTTATKNKTPVENFCEVCNVACSSSDAYTAHLRGQKHQKSMKVWIQMGKEIPESLKPQVVKVIPKTNFTVGGTLNTLTGMIEPSSDRPQNSLEPVIANPAPPPKDDKPLIGKECIVEEKDKHGKVVNYKCTICDCEMNNKYMRDDHLKGRKHITEYKLKVNPNLKVNDKRLNDAFKQIEQIRMQAEQQEMLRREHREQGMRNKLGQKEREVLSAFPERVQLSSVPSPEDHIVWRKHSEISPTPIEIQAVDHFLSVIESALKLVSECLCAEKQTKEKELKAVMRIGSFAKGLSLKGDTDFSLVVLCQNKPSQTLLTSIHKYLSEKLVEVNLYDNNEVFKTELNVESCSVIVSVSTLGYSCSINVTSPAVREDPDPATDPEDALDKAVCNTYLAEMRRAKWFDSKSKINSALIIIVRVLTDLKRRIPTWKDFPAYIIELLCDKALRTVAHDMGPAELLRRFFEVVSAGILLPGENGVYDPCEKNSVNAAKPLLVQDSQDITTSAQHALRLIALNQLEKVLGLKSKPPTEQIAQYAQPTTTVVAPYPVISQRPPFVNQAPNPNFASRPPLPSRPPFAGASLRPPFSVQYNKTTVPVRVKEEGNTDNTEEDSNCGEVSESKPEVPSQSVSGSAVNEDSDDCKPSKRIKEERR